MSRLFPLLLLPLLLAACAPPPTIRTAKIVPARIFDPARPRQVTVIPLAGDTDGSFAGALKKSLTGISIDGHPYFTLNDAGKVGAAEGATLGKQFSDADAVAIGRAAGAEGVLTGTVTVDFEERQPREQRTVCLRADEDGGCLRWGDASVPCTQRDFRMTFSPRLIVTEKGRISYGKSIKGKSSAVTCGDTPTAVSGREELLRQVEELILKEFRKDIAPHFVPVEVPIMNSSEGIPSGEGRDLFIQGILAAEENRPDRACVLWEKAARFPATSPSLEYDLGVCRELAGELEGALEEYQKSEALLKSPHESVTTALDRVRKEIATRAKVTGDGGR